MIHPVSVCLCETGPTLSKIVIQWLQKWRVNPCCFRFVAEADFGSSAPPRTCSCTRGRLAKNIPERVTVVAAGIDEDIRTREKVNTFFHFFEKNFAPQNPRQLDPHAPEKRSPANPVSIGVCGRSGNRLSRRSSAESDFIGFCSRCVRSPICATCGHQGTARSPRTPRASLRPR
jgi:hypothetical protein